LRLLAYMTLLGRSPSYYTGAGAARLYSGRTDISSDLVPLGCDDDDDDDDDNVSDGLRQIFGVSASLFVDIDATCRRWPSVRRHPSLVSIIPDTAVGRSLVRRSDKQTARQTVTTTTATSPRRRPLLSFAPP